MKINKLPKTKHFCVISPTPEVGKIEFFDTKSENYIIKEFDFVTSDNQKFKANRIDLLTFDLNKLGIPKFITLLAFDEKPTETIWNFKAKYPNAQTCSIFLFEML